MGKIYLCGHTGSINRGCEAIIRSTSRILRGNGYQEIAVLTFNREDDSKLNLNEAAELIPYPKKTLLTKIVSYFRRRLLKDWEWGARYLYSSVFQKLKKEDVLFNVGGDTYCYGMPYISYTLNLMAEEKSLPVVFWGCSVDQRVMEDKQMQEDINRYTYIVARETLSFELLRAVVSDREKVFLACDPAFQLPMEETQLPEGFQVGNTLGINVFPVENRPLAMENIQFFMKQVLDQTDMHICLIPHVYDATKKSADLEILQKLYEQYKATGRVSIVRQELSCMQLKYIISQCRFFVGARTHSIIAAYSTEVPALALSYSIKSRGLAKDILGDESYALPWGKMKTESTLWDVFAQKILSQEVQLHQRYQEVLPEYKQTILTVCAQIMEQLGDKCERPE